MSWTDEAVPVLEVGLQPPGAEGLGMGGWDSKLAGEIGAGQGSQFSAGIHKHCVCWGDGV